MDEYAHRRFLSGLFETAGKTMATSGDRNPFSWEKQIDTKPTCVDIASFAQAQSRRPTMGG